MNTDWTGIYTGKECHKTESRWNYTTTDHKEGEKLEDQRDVDEKFVTLETERIKLVQSLMFMMVVMMTDSSVPRETVPYPCHSLVGSRQYSHLE